MNRLTQAINTLIVSSTILGVFFIGYIRPSYNWDMIGYVASAYHLDGHSGADLSALTYKAVKEEVTPSLYNELTTGDYRETVYSDPKALEQQLPFYTIRVAYVGLMRGLNAVGLPYPKASYAISAFFAGSAVLLLTLLLKKFLVPVYLLPLIVVFGGVTHLARLSTPDAIACFFSLSAIYFIKTRNNIFLLIAAALPIFRTDFLILSLLIAIYGFFKGERFKAISSIAAALILYLLINKFADNYGWLTIFNFTLIGINPYPADMQTASSLWLYFKPYLSASYQLLHHAHGIVYALGIGLLLRGRAIVLTEDEKSIVYISLFFTALHLFAFPAYMDRFFVFAAVSILIVFTSALLRIKQ